MGHTEYLGNQFVQSVGSFEIIETGWRTDGLFVVILGADERAFLETEEAQEYARVVASRRRQTIPVTAEQVEPGRGSSDYQRVFCFTQSDKKKWTIVSKHKKSSTEH